MIGTSGLQKHHAIPRKERNFAAIFQQASQRDTIFCLDKHITQTYFQ